MFKKITMKLGRRASLTQLKVLKHSPEMGVGLGLVALGAAAVLLARAHKRSDDVHAENKGYVDLVERDIDQVERDMGVPYDARQRAQILAPVYTRYAIDVVKLYAPPVILGTIGTGLVLGAHKIQRSRIQGLGAALLVVQQGFEEYRKRVIGEQGEEADRRFLWGLDTQTVSKVHVTEDGKKKKTKVEENRIGESLSPTMYSRLFDHTCPSWMNDGQVTQQILINTEAVFNELLHRKGYVYLNEVYRSLGYEETKAGQVVGWHLEAPGSDRNISFGLDNEATDEMIRRNIWMLDFNVDGSIWELME